MPWQLSPSLLGGFLSRAKSTDFWGQMGLYLFAFQVLQGYGGAYLGLGIMLFALIFDLSAHGWRRVQHDPLVWATGAYLLFLGLNLISTLALGPQSQQLALDGARGLLIRGFLPVLLVAYWVRPDANRILWSLGIALIGFLIRLVEKADLDKLQSYLEGTGRATFGYSAISFGTWAAIALLGLCLFLPRLTQLREQSLLYWPAVLAWLGLALVLSFGIIASISRGVWIAVLVVFPPVLFFFYRKKLRLLTQRWLWLAAFSVLAGAAVMVSSERLAHRLETEQATVEQQLLVGSNLEASYSLPLEIRVHLYKLFWEKWSQRPLIGWGPGASAYFIESSRDPLLADFKHFHNSYAEILMQLGLVGLGFFLFLFYRIAVAIRRGCSAYPQWADVLYFTAGGLMIIGLVAFTDNTFNKRGAFCFAVLGGIAYALGYLGLGERSKFEK